MMSEAGAAKMAYQPTYLTPEHRRYTQPNLSQSGLPLSASNEDSKLATSYMGNHRASLDTMASSNVLKVLNRRKKLNLETTITAQSEIVDNSDLNSLASSKGPNPSVSVNMNGTSTATERIQKLSTDLQRISSERDAVVNEKQVWLTKVKDDNQRLTKMLTDIRSMKESIIQKIDSNDLTQRENIDQLNNLETMVGKLEISEFQKQPRIIDISCGRSILSQWEDEYSEIDASIRENVHDLLTAHVTQFVQGHPLSQGIKGNILRESIYEMVLQCTLIVGKSVVSLVQTGVIHGPISPESDTFDDFQENIMKILHSTTVHSEISCTVTLLLTYLFKRFSKLQSTQVTSSVATHPSATQPQQTAISSPLTISVSPIPGMESAIHSGSTTTHSTPYLLEPGNDALPISPVFRLNKAGFEPTDVSQSSAQLLHTSSHEKERSESAGRRASLQSKSFSFRSSNPEYYDEDSPVHTHTQMPFSSPPGSVELSTPSPRRQTSRSSITSTANKQRLPISSLASTIKSPRRATTTLADYRDSGHQQSSSTYDSPEYQSTTLRKPVDVTLNKSVPRYMQPKSATKK